MIPCASQFGFRSRGVAALCTSLVAVVACSSSSNKPDGGGSSSGGDGSYTCAMAGGAVMGAQDTHCVGMPIQVVDPTMCMPPEGGAPGDDGGGSAEGGAAEGGAGADSGGGGDDGGGAMDAGDIGNCGDPAFGATMDNSHGEDDDCKYDVTWTSTPICENEPVYFTVTVKYRTDNTAVRGANARPDVVLNCNHPIMNMPADPSPEVMPGTYQVGPIVFDKPGKWVFRFHFFENCQDQPYAPHGHAAFYVQVP